MDEFDSLTEFGNKLEKLYDSGVSNDWDEKEGTLDMMAELELVAALCQLKVALMGVKKAELLQIRRRAEAQLKGLI
jgi:hypothetical protein